MLTAICILYSLCVGIYLISYVQKQIATGFRKGVWKLRTAEAKVIIVLCYYALFGLVALSYFAVESAYQGEQLQAIQQYFVCEAVGSGTECDRSGFDNFGYHFLTILAYLMLGLLPTVNLTFVINWTAASQSCKRFWMKHFSKTTISQANTANNETEITDAVETNI